MVLGFCLFWLVNLFLCQRINAAPNPALGRLFSDHAKGDLPYGGWAGGSDNPSGGIPGAYYGTGNNPNYGDLAPNRNDADNGIHVMDYSLGFVANNNYNLNFQRPSQAQSHYTSNNIYSNLWQRPQRPFENYYINRPYNRYPPGSQGWYATGGNYWYNKGSCTLPPSWSLVTSILLSVMLV